MLKFLLNKKLFFLGIIIAFFVAVLDLASKKIIFSILENIAIEQDTQNPQIAITSFFNLVYVKNFGVSFGMFSTLENSQIIFTALQFSIAIILCFWLYSNSKKHITWALGFIIGGAFGNSIDRWQNSAVADFLDFYFKNYHWPAFNLADSAVFIGVMILIFEDFIFKKNDKKKTL